jgi:exodeoxyribonuclease-3
MYTFWDCKQNCWGHDGGLRLDHVLLSSVVSGRPQEAGVDRDTRGMEGASDHAPIWIKIRDVPTRLDAPLRRARG